LQCHLGPAGFGFQVVSVFPMFQIIVFVWFFVIRLNRRRMTKNAGILKSLPSAPAMAALVVSGLS
jgi:preprotein translocase subunit YajC